MSRERSRGNVGGTRRVAGDQSDIGPRIGTARPDVRGPTGLGWARGDLHENLRTSISSVAAAAVL